jgi:hypothetical protein
VSIIKTFVRFGNPKFFFFRFAPSGLLLTAAVSAPEYSHISYDIPKISRFVCLSYAPNVLID